jgi:hypothetical protein
MVAVIIQARISWVMVAPALDLLPSRYLSRYSHVERRFRKRFCAARNDQFNLTHQTPFITNQKKTNINLWLEQTSKTARSGNVQSRR